MSEPLTLKVAKPVRVTGWASLRDAAEALVNDSTDHRYGGSYNSRNYCANVKVHSYPSLDTAIAALPDDISDEVKEQIEDEFGDSSSWFYDWLGDEARYLQDDWFKGCAHSGREYWETKVVAINEGKPTNFPAIDELKTKRARLKKLREMADEDELFIEALNAADDGDSIQWEGRQGGYITWDARFDVEEMANEVFQSAESAVDGDPPYYHDSYLSALSDFREAERVHNLNLALIEFLEDWANRMDGQDELNHRVSEFYENEISDEEKNPTGEGFFEIHSEVVVTFRDSIQAGNCESGTMIWLEANLPGRDSATVGELMQIEDSKPLVRRACRAAIKRHLNT